MARFQVILSYGRPMARRLIVAIDGPAGAGKSTAAKRLATELGYTLLDTGAIYRSLALSARRCGVAWDDGPGVAALAGGLGLRFARVGDADHVFLDDEDVGAAIRTPEISDGASRVSALPEVRAALLGLQRQLGARGGVVAEGRDIGTVVFPGAEAKFFLVADPAERARRRGEELRAAGRDVDEAATLRDIEERDRRDSTRQAAPLRKADDAIELDSTRMTPAEVVAEMVRVVRGRGG